MCAPISTRIPPGVADRLSQLEVLRAGGTLTDAEYQAQRQRILDTI